MAVGRASLAAPRCAPRPCRQPGAAGSVFTGRHKKLGLGANFFARLRNHAPKMLCLELSSQELIVRSGGDTAADAARPGKARGQKSQTHKKIFFGEYIYAYMKKIGPRQKSFGASRRAHRASPRPRGRHARNYELLKKVSKKISPFPLELF